MDIIAAGLTDYFCRDFSAETRKLKRKAV